MHTRRLLRLAALVAVTGYGCAASEDAAGALGSGGVAAPERDAGPHTLADAADGVGGAGGAGGQMGTGGTQPGADLGAIAGGATGDAAVATGGQAGDAVVAPSPDTGNEADAAPPAGPCGADVPVIDLNAADGTFDGDLTTAPHVGLAGLCGGAAGGEFVFSYTLDHPIERLTFSTEHPETQAPAVLYLRRPGCEPADEIACDRGTADHPGRRLALDAPAPGQVLIVVDTGARDGPGRFRLTAEVEEIPPCRDTLDNDADGRVDNADPGCAEANDPDEADPDVRPACSDGQDNDADGLADHPLDPDCVFAGGDREAPLCPEGTTVLQVAAGQDVVPLPDLQGNGGATASCDPLPGPEHVLVLNLDEASHVTVEVLENGAPWATAVSMRAACADAATEFGCLASRGPGRLRRDFVPAGPLYIFVEDGLGAPAGPREAHITIESAITECNDGQDNDFDAALDLDDDGCEGLSDDLEGDAPGPVDCNDGADNDADGLADWPDDPGCAARGDTREGGCTGNPLWQPVECAIRSWVWSSDRAFPDLQSAAANQVLWSGCMHDGQNPQGLCSLDGTGWVSVDTFPMVGCDASWWHIGGEHTGGCGGHDGDTVRHLALTEDQCWDYR
jgi:hypothetical protein